jgi:hypothetical protein
MSYICFLNGVDAQATWSLESAHTHATTKPTIRSDSLGMKHLQPGLPSAESNPMRTSSHTVDAAKAAVFLQLLDNLLVPA